MSSTGGVAKYPDSVQYGYSFGRQFPPFNAIDKPDAVISVFEKGFMVPFHFSYLKVTDDSHHRMAYTLKHVTAAAS